MTDQVSGSSLPQTRDLLGRQQRQEQNQEQEQQHQHQSTHLRFRNVHSSHQHHSHNHHNHHHHHHARSQRDEKLDERNASDDNADTTSDVVVIVETISVLQVTDLNGSTITQTLVPTSATTPVITGSYSESTAASNSEQGTPSSGSANSNGNGVADSSSGSSIQDSTVTSSGSSMPVSFPTLSYAPITSAPLSATPVFPSLSGLHNSTLLFSASSNSSASLHSFTTASERNFSAFGGLVSSHSKTTHDSSSIHTHSAFETSKSESSSSVTYITSTVEPNVTPANGGNGIYSTSELGNGDGPTSTPTPDAGSGNTPAATIAGSVVGAISGLVIILLVAAAILRWKKRQLSTAVLQGSRGSAGHSAVTTGGSEGPGGGGSGGSGAMAQRRRSIPFAISATLANLSGNGRFSKSTVSSDGGERGFAKISGRKLPPVLQFGGDGYSDPRESRMSDQSIDYRASHNFFGEAPLSRLAVGSPMLQETGVPVFHASPARTATATPGPFSNPFSDDHAIESPSDLVGFLRPSYDRPTGSRGSFSRFTENL